MPFAPALILVFLAVAPGIASGQSRQEVALAKQVLGALQRPSILQNAEYCGYLGYDRAGQLVASKATRGKESSCLAREPRNIEVIVASYHTHGAYSDEYFSEIPSGTDMEGDENLGIDGYVATPGGRLWYVDTTDMVTSQICGFGCLPRDGQFRRGAEGHIRQFYTYKQLVRELAQ